MGKQPRERFDDLQAAGSYHPDILLTIEPILDFDLKEFVDMIRDINPKWVNIGADSQRHNLPEPTREKVDDLIKELKKFTEIKEKSNLKRLK